MPDSPAPSPLDLSGHRDLPPEEVAPLLERAADSEDERAVSVVTALLMNRLLRLLRQGSRQEILDESLMLNRFLAVEVGSRLRRRRPETYGGWSTLGELLSGAARSTGRAAVPALLRGTQGLGQKILEILAGEAGAVPRSRIKSQLDLAEAHLSHLLRDLEEADLIVRYRSKGSKEVFVELGPAGREVVSHSVLPPWVERLASAAASGAPIDPDALARELEDAGAPRLSAETLARALAAKAPSAAETPTPRKEKSNVLPFVKEAREIREGGEYHLQVMLDFQGDQPPRAMFQVPAARR